MTPTARWAIARRRRRLVISQTLRDRARTDPRRSPHAPHAQKKSRPSGG